MNDIYIGCHPAEREGEEKTGRDRSIRLSHLLVIPWPIETNTRANTTAADQPIFDSVHVRLLLYQPGAPLQESLQLE